MTRALQHLGIISVQDEYGTPYNVLGRAIKDFGIWPLLDVCSNQTNKKCLIFYSKERDALLHEWDLDFFMNPPYSKVKQFMKYAYEQHKKHNVNALILTFAKTDTKWWHQYVEKKAEVHFIQGRIRFLNGSGHLTKHPAPYPSVWIIYRKEK